MDVVGSVCRRVWLMIVFVGAFFSRLECFAGRAAAGLGSEGFFRVF